MPSRKDIEEFSRAIDGLGSEEEASRKKEAPSPKKPKEEDLGLSEPLGPLDFDAAPEEQQPPEQGEGKEEPLDFTSLFGEDAASSPFSGPLTEPELTGGEEAQIPTAPGAAGAGTEGFEETELGPEPDLSSLSSDIDQMGLIGEPGTLDAFAEAGQETGPAPEGAGVEMAGFEAGGAEPAGAEPALPPELEDLAGLASEPVSPPARPEAAPEASAENPADTFDASSFFESAGEPVSPEALSGLMGGEPGPEEPAFPPVEESAAPSEPSGIELPSFDEMNVVQEEQALEQGAAAVGRAAGAPEAPKAPAAEEELFFPEGLEMGEDAEPKAPAAAPMEETPEQGRDELALDEFTLPESVKEFGIPPKTAPTPKARREELAEPASESEAVEELAAPDLDITLSDEQFARLRRTLDSLPRNLKIAIEDIVAAGRGSGTDLKKLVSLLVQGAPPRELAALAGSITGTRIRLPAGVEKKTGLAFEEEQRTFGYAFRQNILPIVRVFSLTLIGFALFIFLGYRYLYLPISSFVTYRSGYDHLMGNRVQLANQSFDKATSIWPMKNWYYRYAEGFAQKAKFEEAAAKYQQLLKRWPGDKKGILDFAAMRSQRQGLYQDANTLLQQILEKNMWDYDALLAAGDNALEWASENPSHLEEARLDYATLIERYGEKEALLFRMLRYFVRTDKKAEAETLREYFASRKDIKVDPQAYAEYGGYLIDKNDMIYAQDVLMAARDAKPDLPLIHYNLARYYRAVKDPAEERKALTAALANMKPTDIMDQSRITMEVDSHRLLGELDYSSQAYLEAEGQYKAAVAVVEQAQKNNLTVSGPAIGLAYHDLADFNYYHSGNLENALDLYTKAASNGYADRDLDYKVGYIRYYKGDYQAAMDRFLSAFEKGSPALTPPNLLFAIANTFYQRDDVFVAQGYYLELAKALNDRAAAMAIQSPQGQPEQESIVVLLMEVNNNLGVATLRISEKMGDRKKRSEALTYLSAAVEQYDALTRNPETMQRIKETEQKALPELNMKGILYPPLKFDPQIFKSLPKDLEVMWQMPKPIGQ